MVPVEELKANWLENVVKEKDDAIDHLHKEIDQLRTEQSSRETEVNGLECAIREKDGIIDDLRRKLEGAGAPGDEQKANGLEHALREKDGIIDELRRKLEAPGAPAHELESNWLESVVREKDAAIEALRKQNDDLLGRPQLETTKDSKLELRADVIFLILVHCKDLQHTIDDLRRELDEKNAQLQTVNHIKNEIEWSLGEHKQWLGDSNRRIGELSGELDAKNLEIDGLNRKIREMKRSIHDRLTFDEAEELRERCEFLETELHEVNFLLKEVENLADVKAGWLEKIVSERDATVDALRNENNELRAENEAIKQEAAKREAKSEELFERLETKAPEAEAPKTEDIKFEKSSLKFPPICCKMKPSKRGLDCCFLFTRYYFRANGLESACKDKDTAIDALRKEVDELKNIKLETQESPKGDVEELRQTVEDLELKLKQAQQTIAEAPKPEDFSSLNSELDRLRHEMGEKNAIIDDVNRQRDEARWSLGEHKQWLNDANNRATALENALREKEERLAALERELGELKTVKIETPEDVLQNEIAQLKAEIQDLEGKLQETEKTLGEAPKVEEINGLRAEIDRLVNEINEKNRIIDDLNRIRDEKEWQLGEHRQWLNDANNRANGLDNELRAKSDMVDNLRKENEELRASQKMQEELSVREQIPPQSSVQDLEQKLHDAQMALAEAPKIDEMKANDLQNTLSEKDSFIGSLQKELNDLRPIKEKLPEAAIEDEVKQLHEKVQNLENQLNDREQALAEAPKPDEINVICRANGLECAIKDKDGFIEKLQRELDELRTVKVETPESTEHDEVKQLHEKVQDLEGQLRDKESALAQAPTPEEMRCGLVLLKKSVWQRYWKSKVYIYFNKLLLRANCLETALQEKNSIIDGLRKENDDLKKVPEVVERAEVKQLESQQLAPVVHSDEDIKANNFENACNDKDAIIDALRREMEGLKTVTSETLHGALPAEGEDLAKLHDTIEDLRKSLHETEQKLAAAPNSDDIKANGLECAIKEKDGFIEKLQRELDELRTVKVETPESTEHDEVKQLHEKMQDLEGQLRDKESALAQAPTPEEIRANNLENAIKDKNGLIGSLQKELDELRTVSVATTEGALQDEIKQLRDNVHDLEAKLHDSQRAATEAPKAEEIKYSFSFFNFYEIRSRASGLENVLKEKDDVIDGLRKEIDDLKTVKVESPFTIAPVEEIEADGLEKAISEKDDIISGLRQENDDLRAYQLETSGSVDTVNKLREYVENLESQLRSSRTEIDRAPTCEELEANGLENSIKEKDATIEELRKAVEDLKGVSQQIPELEDRIRLLERQPTESVDHAQPIAPSQDEIKANALEGASADKDRLISELRKEIDELKSLKLEAADDGERQQLREKVQHLEGKLQETERLLAEAVKPDIISTLESTINELRNELADKNTQMEHLSKERNDAEWRLGEHKQWLADANKRNEELSNSLKEKEDAMKALRATHDEVIYITEEVVTRQRYRPSHVRRPCPNLDAESNSIQLRARIDELERTLKEVEASAQSSKEARERSEQSVLRETISSLHGELNLKNGDIERLRKERNDFEWSLGEHRQWLADSRNRIAELEHEISKLKDGYESALKSARTEVYELHERNIKLEETLKKTEVIVINLQKEKEATRRSLILEQPRVEFKNREELEEEIKRLREKYDELSKLLKCTDELLAKLQAEAPDTADVEYVYHCALISLFLNSIRWNEIISSLVKELLKQRELKCALSKTIQDLRHELNYQKVIDTLTEQKKDTEKSLTEQTNLLSDAYKKINELEDLLSKSAEERDEALKNAAYKSVKMLQEEVEITRTLQEDEAHVRIERSVQREPTPSREDIKLVFRKTEYIDVCLSYEISMGSKAMVKKIGLLSFVLNEYFS
ncbi:unnamed protein product [Toxocara canis]|uniref:GRIP domain-containing protein n=1 Tax=Toxocara canis TaxID=6265 RepID=A0A183UNN7_TOXCA|nr:unnamed protein product [Toxocara canis]